MPARILIAVFALLACWALVPGQASAAAVASASLGKEILIQSDSAGDTMTVQCVAGQARYIQGATNLLPCGDVETLQVVGAEGNDVVNLQSITAADFPKLNVVILNGGDDTDTLNGTQIDDSIIDGETVSAGAGNDDVDGGTQVDGGPGNDTVTSGGVVSGGDGDDLIVFAQQADGGPGNDRFRQFAGTGPFAGGPGVDTIDLDTSDATEPADLGLRLTDASLAIGLVGQPALSTLALSSIDRFLVAYGRFSNTNVIDATGYSGSIRVDGGPGPEAVVGGSGEDSLYGNGGNDVLDGGAGFDYVDGGVGADELRLRDGEPDRGLCGTEADSVTGDADDVIAADCETIDVPDIAPPDTTGLKGPKKLKAGKAGKFEFGSTEPESTFTCAIDKGPVVACTSPFSVKSKKPGKHTLTVIATDAAGNADLTPATADFTVKKKKKKKH
jgi:hemolysin type calcium-binding protein